MAERLRLSKAGVDAASDSELAVRITDSGSNVELAFPLPSIGHTNDPYDIAQDYLAAAYFTERLSGFCGGMRVEPVPRDYFLSLLLKFKVADANGFAHELRNLSPFLEDDADSDPAIRRKLLDFEDTLFQRKLRLPTLGDDYVANFIMGTVFNEHKRYWCKRHPTWRWGFWRSFASEDLNCEVYLSNQWYNVWIVLGDRRAVENVLVAYAGFAADGARLIEAASVRVGRAPHLLVSGSASVRVPSAHIGAALRCWRRCIAPDQARSYVYPREKLSSGPPAVQKDAAEASAALNKTATHFERARGQNWECRYDVEWAMTEEARPLSAGIGRYHSWRLPTLPSACGVTKWTPCWLTSNEPRTRSGATQG